MRLVIGLYTIGVVISYPRINSWYRPFVLFENSLFIPMLLPKFRGRKMPPFSFSSNVLGILIPVAFAIKFDISLFSPANIDEELHGIHGI